MKKETAITTLEDYNIWRRGGDIDEMPDVTTIGEAIDEAIKVLKESITVTSKPETEHKTGWYVVNAPGWEKYIAYEDLENGKIYGVNKDGDWFDVIEKRMYWGELSSSNIRTTPY